MKIRRGLLHISAVLAAFGFIASPASATFTHYYYDAQGRLLGALSTAHEMRTSQTDQADNPSYLHVFPVAARSVASTLPLYGALIADQYLTSPDGRFTFNIQEDGNAVVYFGSQALWATGTSGKQPGWFTMGGDGNLHYFGPDDSTLWQTNISSSTGNGAQLVMQNDGNLVVFQNGAAVWSTGTGGH